MKSLVEIFQEQGTTTDKLSVHGYPYYYEELFAPIRHTTKTVLEIGICEGGSLRAWRDYFPLARIYGLDIVQKFVDDVRGEGIYPYLIDASDEELLYEWSRGEGFDIIIDDGSHKYIDIFVAFNTLWLSLNPGGYYIIEDAGQTDQPCAAIFESVLESTLRNQYTATAITFRPNMIVVQKRRENDMSYPALGSL